MREQRRQSEAELGRDQTDGKGMRVRKPVDSLEAGLMHQRTQCLEVEVNDMLRSLERWPTAAHKLSQYTSYVGSGENNVAPGLRVVG